MLSLLLGVTLFAERVNVSPLTNADKTSSSSLCIDSIKSEGVDRCRDLSLQSIVTWWIQHQLLRNRLHKVQLGMTS